MATRIQVVFAAKDPGRLAEFWRTALGYGAEPPPDGYATWEEFAEAHGIDLKAGTDIDSAIDPDGVGPRFLFERDEPRASGVVHIDVNIAGRGRAKEDRKAVVDAEVERLTAAGATKTRVVDHGDQYFVEMNDPEGNWFCVQ
jgi:glyoxalase superfamily protein